MGIVKVLKRKDAASVVVAIVVAMILFQLVMTVTAKWSGQLSGLEDGQYMGAAFPGATWKALYLHPAVSAVLQLIALEILVWVYVLIAGVFKKK